MSKVAISGNASGTGTFTIQAPNSNTDRVLSLPDEAGTVLTSASTISGLGSLTGVDSWYITSAFVTSSNDSTQTLTANWSRFTGTNDSPARIGDAMTQSSGVFTFPQTGMWLVVAQYALNPNGVNSNYNYGSVAVSVDGGSNFSDGSFTWANLDSSRYTGITSLYPVDVTDTSLVKVSFRVRSQQNIVVEGGANEIRTGAFFIRLGDT